MPDLKTELMKIQPLTSLSFDDEGDNTVEVVTEPTNETPHTMSHTQELWECVKVNPGIDTSELARKLPHVDAAGIATRLNQLHKRGLITRTRSVTTGRQVNHAATETYISMAGAERSARMQEGRRQWLLKQAEKKAKRRAKANSTERVKEHKAEPVVAEPTAPVVTEMADVDLFVSRLTVGDARNLYDALKRVFFS